VGGGVAKERKRETEMKGVDIILGTLKFLV
jgi:hypothetical protein